jgi:tight adherence protein C
MDAMIIVIPVLIFGLVVFAVIGIAHYVSYKKERQDILKKVENKGRTAGPDTSDVPMAGIQRLLVGIARRLGSLAKPKEEAEISHLRVRFMQAGLSRMKNATLVFYGSKVLCAMCLPTCFFVIHLVFFHNMIATQIIFMTLVAALIGFYIPVIWLKMRINNRREQILRGFPDGLDLMVVCAEAGMGLDSVINRVGEEIKMRHKALSEEFRLLTLELRAGKLRRDALKNLAMRCASEDVQSFTTLLIQTEQFGTNVAQAMRVQADSMRTKKTQRVEELAASLPVKLLFPTILCIFPSLFLVLIGPALIQAFRVWKG